MRENTKIIQLIAHQDPRMVSSRNGKNENSIECVSHILSSIARYYLTNVYFAESMDLEHQSKHSFYEHSLKPMLRKTNRVRILNVQSMLCVALNSFAQLAYSEAYFLSVRFLKIFYTNVILIEAKASCELSHWM